jgi:hypothetical protein
MKSAEEFLKKKYNRDHISADLRLSKRLVLENMEEYASQALAELRAENEELKRQIKSKRYLGLPDPKTVNPYDAKSAKRIRKHFKD